MFGFEHIKMGNEDGSEERFHERIAIHKEKEVPVQHHHFWWFMHNCVAHFLIGICPIKLFFRFHDWTSKKIMAAE